jgi:hypothetical protein
MILEISGKSNADYIDVVDNEFHLHDTVATDHTAE